MSQYVWFDNEDLEIIDFLKLQFYQMQLHTYIGPNVIIMHHLSDKLIKSCDLNGHKLIQFINLN